MPRRLRIALMVAVALLLLPIAAVAVFVLTFDANAYKSRIAEAARRATGRELVLAGPLHLTPSLHPVIVARDVALANVPGGSRPQMLSVGEMRAQLALLPLLHRRVEIESVTLVRPDILLETDAGGRGNWQFDRPEPAASATATPSAPSRPIELDIQRIALTDASVTWRNGQTGRAVSATVPKGVITLGSAPVHAAATVLYEGRTFETALSGSTLAEMRAGQIWPLSLRADAPGLSLDAAWPAADQPVRVKAAGSLNGTPWELAANATAASGGVALRGLAAKFGDVGDVAGDVAVAVAGVPSLRGTLVSQRLDLDALHSVLPTSPPATSAPQAGPAPEPPAPAWVISDRPLPFAALHRANTDLQLSVATLHAWGADYRGVATHAVLRNGALTLDPMTVQAPRVDLSFSTDASQSPPPVALAGRAAGFALRPLLAALGLPAGSDAAVDVDLALRSAGASPHALAAGLEGHAGLAMVDGDVENALLTRLFGGVLRAANVPVDLSGRSHVRCLAVRLDAAGGHADIRTLKLDSTRLQLDGTGGADLGAETLALKLRPELLLGGAGVLAPVQVGGSFAHPQVALDSPGAPGRVGVVIGGAPREDSCPTDLTAARDGRPGPMPAAATPRSLKPADLLRNFLR